MTEATTKTASVSLSDLIVTDSPAFEFEFKKPDGSDSGIFFSVIGSHTDQAKATTEKLMDQRRRRDAVRSANVRPGQPEPITPFAEDVEFNVELAASRLAGWRGIKEDFSPDLAKALCAGNPEVAAQVMAESNKLANFTKASPKS